MTPLQEYGSEQAMETAEVAGVDEKYIAQFEKEYKSNPALANNFLLCIIAHQQEEIEVMQQAIQELSKKITKLAKTKTVK